MPLHPLKRRRPKKPQLTRAQLHQLVGKAICDHLLREPKLTHYHGAAAQGIIEEVLGLLAAQPYY